MWEEIYARVSARLIRNDAFQCIFRGHRESSWELLPGVGRGAANLDLEKIIYFDFVTMAGSLLPENASPWSIALAMQHHGLPTRLLDWTDNFAVALFFALRNQTTETACVWMLDPYKLNDEVGGGNNLMSFPDLSGDYADFFIEESKKIGGKVIAVAPNRHHPRAFSQKSFFTIHEDVETPIEKLCPAAVEKIEIPKEARPGARRFLAMAGVNEFSLFPDLDGLARELKRLHL